MLFRSNEVLVSLGIWAFGLAVYTILVRITIPVLSGRLTVDSADNYGQFDAGSVGATPTREENPS